MMQNSRGAIGILLVIILIYTSTVSTATNDKFVVSDDEPFSSSDWQRGEYLQFKDEDSRTENGPSLLINITGGFYLFYISATIKNLLDVALEDVEWEITVRGGFLNRIDFTDDGTIATIKPNGERTVRTRFHFGFGKIHILASAHSVSPVNASGNKCKHGFQFGFFSWIYKLR